MQTHISEKLYHICKDKYYLIITLTFSYLSVIRYRNVTEFNQISINLK